MRLIAISAIALIGATDVHAVTLQECRASYKTAQAGARSMA
jgi:hypothetical protein